MSDAPKNNPLAAMRKKAPFFQALFEPDDLVEIRAIGPAGQVERDWVPARTLADFSPPHRWIDEKFGIYFGANPRSGRGGSTADVPLARCMFVDFDGVEPDDALVRIKAASLPKPNVMLSSGGGVHAYWRLAEPMTDLAAWTARQKALIAALGSDPVVHDPPRVMRFPSTMNTKYDPPRRTRVLRAGVRSRHSLDHFPAPASLPAEGASKPATTPRLPEATPDLERRAAAYLDAMPAAISGEGGHSRTYAAATALVHGFGLPTETAFHLLATRYNPKCQPPWSDHELRHKIDDAATKPHGRPFGWLRESGGDAADGPPVDLSGFIATKKRTTASAFGSIEPEASEAALASGATPSTRLRVRCFADVEATEIDWIWPGRVARGKITLLAGHPGQGKSFLTCDIAARVSAGLAWPDGSPANEPGDVLILNCEDDPSDTIRPRLDAAGADVRRVHFVDGVASLVREQTIDPFELAEHTPILREHILANPGVRMLVLDPVTAFASDRDDNKNAQVRGMLRPLAELAHETDVAVVLVTHLNKGFGEAVHRVLGSVAWSAAARAAWAIVRDPEDDKRRLMLNIKNNVGLETLGMAYRIGVPDDPDAHPVESVNQTPQLLWEEDPITIRADSFFAAGQDDSPSPGSAKGEPSRSPALQEAIDALDQILADGPVPAKEVEAELKVAGISIGTAKRAKGPANIVSRKMGFRGETQWVWMRKGEHPPEDDQPESCSEDPRPFEPLRPPDAPLHGDVGDSTPKPDPATSPST